MPDKVLCVVVLCSLVHVAYAFGRLGQGNRSNGCSASRSSNFFKPTDISHETTRKGGDAKFSRLLAGSSSMEKIEVGGAVRLGFIGCGTIASSIATGFAKQSSFPTRISSISVSKRSEKKSQALKELFPGLVTVDEDNQRIVDSVDIVFLCVLPQQEEEVLSSLEFQQERHTLVSLVATSKLENLKKNSGLPAESVYKMICLPPVAELEGTCLLFPKGNRFLQLMFESLGGCVECETEKIMNAMMIPGCLMGPTYGILRNNRDWLVQQGVPPEDASYFLGRQYLGIIRDAERNCKEPDHFDLLITEQTPGGLNEQALSNLEGQGVFDAYDAAMDALLGRIEGKSDGFVPPKSDPS